MIAPTERVYLETVRNEEAEALSAFLLDGLEAVHRAAYAGVPVHLVRKLFAETLVDLTARFLLSIVHAEPDAFDRVLVLAQNLPDHVRRVAPRQPTLLSEPNGRPS